MTRQEADLEPGDGIGVLRTLTAQLREYVARKSGPGKRCKPRPFATIRMTMPGPLCLVHLPSGTGQHGW